MASTSQKASSCCVAVNSAASSSSAASAVGDQSAAAAEKSPASEVNASLIRVVDAIPESSAGSKAKVGIPLPLRAQSSHPLDPLSATEIKVAVATVRAAGATPEERDGMRFIEVVLLEPEKHVVAMADAYFFPPFQSSLLPRVKGRPVIPTKLPPRKARLVVYNKKSNETTLWTVELTEVHATSRSGHHRGKVISSKVVPDVQPPMGSVF